MMYVDYGFVFGWVVVVCFGDWIGFVGFGVFKFVDFDVDWFLFVGDMFVLFVIGVNIECLFVSVCGYVVLDIFDDVDW